MVYKRIFPLVPHVDSAFCFTHGSARSPCTFFTGGVLLSCWTTCVVVPKV